MSPPAVEVTHGLHAGLAIFSRRRDDIVRIAYTRAVRADVAAVTRWATSCRVPCAETSDKEVDRLTGSSHHEGLGIVAKPRHWLATNALVETLVQHARGGTALALDRVRNPYNVGALLRTAAFFGLDAVLLGAPAPHPGLAPTAVRVAEGGAEHLHLSRTTDLATTLARLRARGVRVVGAEGRAKISAIGFVFARPVVMVVGNEREGLGERIRSACDAVVAVRGGGAMESLNVAVAGGILMAELMKEAQASPPSMARSEKR
jgi:TrmH RNA methyltransferase